MPVRRSFVRSVAGVLLLPLTLAPPGATARALQRRSLADPMRLGVDSALQDSGLAHALQQGFARDTGIALRLVPGPALPLLEALDRGELDAALANAPLAEARLDKEGLVHDRRAIARGDFVLVGPKPANPAHDPLADVRHDDAVAALRALQAAPAGTVGFLSAADGSGGHVVEQALWREAQIAPAGAWYIAAAPSRGLLAQARERSAWALVERAVWLAQGGPPLVMRIEGDSRLTEQVHVMRAFRTNHPAGKLFVDWIAGPKGRRVVAAQRGYRLPTE
jgi:tungstate transport system substrate-binding protein